MIDPATELSPVLGEATIEDLRIALDGTLVRPDTPAYETARRVWNGRADRRPALIVRASGAEDVRRSIQFARSYNLEIAVRGGGHSIAGWGTCNGGIVVDLAGMNHVHVDPRARIARAEPGLTVGGLVLATERFGLITPLGTVSTIGIAGLTVGGGLGWLTGKHGLTVDNLLDADVVLADGRLVRASADENADLFWAIRGGGGNFGVVTSFSYRLHPTEHVLAGVVVHPAQRGREILRFYRDLTQDAPDELTTYAIFRTRTDGLPSLVLAVCHCGRREVGERLVQPIQRLGHPTLETIRPTSHHELSQLFDASAPFGLAYAQETSAVPALTDEVIDILCSHGVDPSSPGSEVIVQHVHGEATRVGISATPVFGLRRPHYEITVRAAWNHGDGRPQIARIAAIGQNLAALTEHEPYVNYLDPRRNPGVVRAVYGSHYEQLAAIKSHYDPTNLFHLNPNILPTSTGPASPR